MNANIHMSGDEMLRSNIDITTHMNISIHITRLQGDIDNEMGDEERSEFITHLIINITDMLIVGFGGVVTRRSLRLNSHPPPNPLPHASARGLGPRFGGPHV